MTKTELNDGQITDVKMPEADEQQNLNAREVLSRYEAFLNLKNTRGVKAVFKIYGTDKSSPTAEFVFFPNTELDDRFLPSRLVSFTGLSRQDRRAFIRRIVKSK